MIADYINGHLDSLDEQLMQRAIEEDPNLRDMVNFERRIQSSIRSTANEDSLVRMPRYANFEQRINKRRWLTPNWNTWGATAAAAVFLIGIMVMQSPSSDFEVNEYQTLSDTQNGPEQPLLRIIGNPATSLAALEGLVNEFELEAVTWHPNLLSVDVLATDFQDIDAMQARLTEDPRVRIVNHIPAE